MSEELDVLEPQEPDTPKKTVPESKKPKKKKMKTWKKVLLITLIVILSLTIIAAVGIFLWVNHLLNQINYDTTPDYTLSSEEVEQLEQENPDYVPVGDDEDLDSMPSIEELEQEIQKDPGISAEPMPEGSVTGDIINILLIGQDRRGEKRARSDSMILLTVNKDKNTITFTSFMRDAYVQIPGYKAHKLCHAFQYGGFSLLNETLWVNYGVRVDGNLEVDFNRFMDLIDLLGGVDIELTQKEVATMKGMGAGGDLKAGMNHLNGKQALAYSRIRYIDSDYARAERQRTVLMSLLNEYKSKELLEMIGLLEDILPLVTTNMEKSDIWNLSYEVFPMVAGATINTQQIPAHGTFKGGNVRVREGLKGWFQYNIDFQKNREILQNIFAGN
ncbi:MAG: LCP family protein [Oscillospiraceae bacterium]|nr:LCP family protein [Oscillospiraceae bacterium]